MHQYCNQSTLWVMNTSKSFIELRTVAVCSKVNVNLCNIVMKYYHEFMIVNKLT